MVGSPAEITVTLFQSVELRVRVALSSLHDGSLLFPASNIADFDIPETKYRHALPLPLQSIMTSATARVAELKAMLTVPLSLDDMPLESRDTECYATEMEQSSPVGVMTTPKDQFGAFITAVVLLWNVMLRL